MKKILIISFALFSYVLNATNYYVATDGNDNNAGTLVAPWATWGKAFTSTSVNAGDTVFIRGGVYNITVTNGDGYSVTRAGTADKWIVYANFPGEVPILDCENVVSPTTQYATCVEASAASGANYIKFIGLTVRNLHQRRKDIMTWPRGFACENGFFSFENCTAYNIEGHGFDSYFYNGWPAVNGVHTFINCDAWNCSNPEVISGYLPGNAGVGFNSQNWYGTEGHAYTINCRAWECGDQGFSWNGEHYCEAVGCWSFNNGKLQGDGHGFKLGWHNRVYPGDGRLNVVLLKSIAAYNRFCGITTNDADEGVATGMNIFNNLVYHNGYGYGSNYIYGIYVHNTPDNSTNELLRIFRNNISFDNIYEPIYVGTGAAYTHSNNSWDGGATITSADFKALPVSKEAGIALLSAPRKPDGSLPDLGDYFQLVSTSDAIDAGIDVGLDYKGLAPDLGPFEYDPGAQQSSAKNIISFTLPQQTGPATINTSTHTVSIEVAHGTNITSLAPTISVSAGATINPASGVARNFSTPQTYVVTAEDESTQTWTVTVTVASEEPGEGKWVPVIKNGEFVIRNGKFVVKYVEDGN